MSLEDFANFMQREVEKQLESIETEV